MYDLDVAIVDTFAVGDGAWVVHNANNIEICNLYRATTLPEQVEIYLGNPKEIRPL